MSLFGVILLLCGFVGCISYPLCMNTRCNVPCDGSSFGFDNIIYSPINSCINSASFGYQTIYNNDYLNINYFTSIKFPFYMTPNMSLIFYCITTDLIINAQNIRSIINGNISNEHIYHHDSIIINEYIEGNEYILPNKCLLNTNNDTHSHALIWKFNGNGDAGLYKACNNIDNIGNIGYGSLTTSCNIPDTYILNTQFIFEFINIYPKNEETTITPINNDSSFCDYYIFCGNTDKGKAATLAFIVLAFICVILLLLLCVSIYVTTNYIKLKRLQNVHQNGTAVNISVPYMDRERVTTISTISAISAEDNNIIKERKKSVNLFPETRGGPEYLAPNNDNDDDNSNVPPPPLPPVLPSVPGISSDESNNSHDKLKLCYINNENGIIKHQKSINNEGNKQ